MNIIVGWMIPEMNCALKLEAYMRSLSSSNSSIARCEWPNTFTRSWPVYICSTWPLSDPVHSHCDANCFWDRLAISIVTTNDRGTVSREITASSGDIQNMMIRIPITVSVEVISWVSTCWRVLETLSMSLVTRESRSPRGCVSK